MSEIALTVPNNPLWQFNEEGHHSPLKGPHKRQNTTHHHSGNQQQGGTDAAQNHKGQTYGGEDNGWNNGDATGTKRTASGVERTTGRVNHWPAPQASPVL